MERLSKRAMRPGCRRRRAARFSRSRSNALNGQPASGADGVTNGIADFDKQGPDLVGRFLKHRKAMRDEGCARRHHAVGPSENAVLFMDAIGNAEKLRRLHRRERRIAAESDGGGDMALFEFAESRQQSAGERDRRRRLRDRPADRRTRRGNHRSAHPPGRTSHSVRRARPSPEGYASRAASIPAPAPRRERDVRPYRRRRARKIAVRTHAMNVLSSRRMTIVASRQRENEPDASARRKQRGAAIGNERQGHALGRERAQSDADIDEALQADQRREAAHRRVREDALQGPRFHIAG